MFGHNNWLLNIDLFLEFRKIVKSNEQIHILDQPPFNTFAQICSQVPCSPDLSMLSN